MLTSATGNNKLDLPFAAWKLIANKQCELIQICLKAGEKIAPHKNPFDVIFYCLSGEASLKIEEESMRFTTGNATFISSNTERGIENASDPDVEFLVIKLLI